MYFTNVHRDLNRDQYCTTRIEFLVILSFTHFYGRAAAELSFSDFVLRTFTGLMKTVISYNSLNLYLYPLLPNLLTLPGVGRAQRHNLNTLDISHIKTAMLRQHLGVHTNQTPVIIQGGTHLARRSSRAQPIHHTRASISTTPTRDAPGQDGTPRRSTKSVCAHACICAAG